MRVRREGRSEVIDLVSEARRQARRVDDAVAATLDPVVATEARRRPDEIARRFEDL